MTRYHGMILLVVLFFCALNAAGAEEKPIFNALNCGICHKADTGKAFPSLKEIGQAYNGDKEKLTGYLQGKSNAIINTEKAKSMEKYIEKTKALSQEEVGVLADFILSNK
jgi:cytochrome c551/c552